VTIIETLVDSEADYLVLSYATKVYCVLLAEEQSLTLEVARRRVRELGWPMEQEQM